MIYKLSTNIVLLYKVLEGEAPCWGVAMPWAFISATSTSTRDRMDSRSLEMEVVNSNMSWETSAGIEEAGDEDWRKDEFKRLGEADE
jgi:hypothetical protein